MGSDAEEHAREEAGDRRGQGERRSRHRARRAGQPAPDEERDDVAPRRAERHADADLSPALADREGDDAVEADGGEQQGEGAEAARSSVPCRRPAVVRRSAWASVSAWKSGSVGSRSRAAARTAADERRAAGAADEEDRSRSGALPGRAGSRRTAAAGSVRLRYLPSRATPTTSKPSPGRSIVAKRRPSGLTPGQKRRASVSLTTATAGAPARSVGAKVAARDERDPERREVARRDGGEEDLVPRPGRPGLGREVVGDRAVGERQQLRERKRRARRAGCSLARASPRETLGALGGIALRHGIEGQRDDVARRLAVEATGTAAALARLRRSRPPAASSTSESATWTTTSAPWSALARGARPPLDRPSAAARTSGRAAFQAGARPKRMPVASATATPYSEHAPVEDRLEERRHVEAREQQVEEPGREQQAAGRAETGEAARSRSGAGAGCAPAEAPIASADPHLPPPPRGAAEQEVGDVGRGDQQNEAGRRERRRPRSAGSRTCARRDPSPRRLDRGRRRCAGPRGRRRELAAAVDFTAASASRDGTPPARSRASTRKRADRARVQGSPRRSVPEIHVSSGRKTSGGASRSRPANAGGRDAQDGEAGGR